MRLWVSPDNKRKKSPVLFIFLRVYELYPTFKVGSSGHAVIFHLDPRMYEWEVAASIEFIVQNTPTKNYSKIKNYMIYFIYFSFVTELVL